MSADDAAVGTPPTVGTGPPSAPAHASPAASPAPADATGTQEDTGDASSREAARYRRRLRTTEGERDQLAGKVERLQRAEVARLAADLAQPGDLFDVAGVQLADVLDADGEVDADAVRAAVADLLRQRPGLRAAVTPTAAQAGLGVADGGARVVGPSFGDLLRGGR